MLFLLCILVDKFKLSPDIVIINLNKLATGQYSNAYHNVCLAFVNCCDKFVALSNSL